MPETASPLKEKLTADMKAAMKGGEKERLGTIRLILSAIKQQEVDTREAQTDEQILVILDKLAKQRRESISQFDAAGRDDLSAKEQNELEIIQTYLPEQLSDAEIDALIDEAIAATSAESVKDMGKVMGLIKPKAQGRADMSAVSAKIKARLTS